MSTLAPPADAHHAIVTKAHEIRSAPSQASRRIPAIRVGEFVRQGDLYCLRIAEPAAGWQRTDRRDLALYADRASRHEIGGPYAELLIPRERPDAYELIHHRDHPHPLHASLAVVAAMHPALVEVLGLSPEQGLADSYTSVVYGPQILASGRFWLSHPEHANISLPPGVYQITYQRDLLRDHPVQD